MQFYFRAHQSHPNFNLKTAILPPGDSLDPVIQVKRNLCFQMRLFFHFLAKEKRTKKNCRSKRWEASSWYRLWWGQYTDCPTKFI